MRIEAPMTITPSQTVGPFYAYCLTPDDYQTIPPIFGRNLATDDAVGQRISISGTLIDGDDHAIPDGMIELWQPDGPSYAIPKLRRSTLPSRRHS